MARQCWREFRRFGSLVVLSVGIGVLVPSSEALPLQTRVGSNGAPIGQYVAMGDSFSSGEGNAPFIEGTDDPGTNECHRSVVAYPERLVSALGHSNDVENVACSGSLTFHLTSEGRWNEPAQINALSGGDVGLVTLTIGGNDIGFAKVVSTCIAGLRACDSKARRSEIAERILELRATLTRTYRRISEELSNSSRILVVGYPRLFAEGRGCGPYSSLGREERVWLNDMAGLLDRVIHRASANAAVEFLSVLDAFGGHELCRGASGTSGTWVNKPTLINKVRSVHPNSDGHLAIAERVVARIPLLFEGDGLGVAAFGEPAGQAMGALRLALGRPDDDSGWINARDLGYAWDLPARELRWGTLFVVFAEREDGSRVFGRWDVDFWRTSKTDAPRTMRTLEGLTWLTNAGQLQQMYPDVTYRVGEGAKHYFDLPGIGLSGTLNGFTPHGEEVVVDDKERVDSLTAGDFPLPECC